MEEFCGGQLWNETLLVENTWPQFTDCFMHTVLIWVPCAFLFLLLPCYVTSVRKRATGVRFKTSNLFRARLCCCILLIALSLVHVAMRIQGVSTNSSPAAYLGDALYIITYVTMCLMTQYERIKGVHTSAVPFFFWLLASLCNVIPMYSMVIQKVYSSHTVGFTVFVVSYSLQVCLLALTCFVNNPVHTHRGDNPDKRPCPETTCSFPSVLTFWWMTNIMTQGYRRDLEASDLWSLPPAEQSDTLTSRFYRLWKRKQSAVHRVTSYRRSRRLMRTRKRSARSEERHPLLECSLDGATASSLDRSAERVPPVKLLRTLLRMMARDFWSIFVMKICSDLFFLFTPVLMGQLMTYLSSRPTGRQWQGYVLCVAMFLALVIRSSLFAHSMFHASRVGLRMKSTLTAAIYRKALTMSPTAKQRASVGEIVNLMSVDAQRVQDVMIVCFYAATAPLQFFVAVLLLYFTIGPAIFVGVLLLLCCIPLNAYVVSRQRRLQSSNLTFKDARVRLFHEILNGIKALKLYGWEPSFREKVRKVRMKEVAMLLKMAVLNSLMSLCWEMAPYLVTLVTFATYVLSDPSNSLDAHKAFVSLSLFNVLRQPLTLLSKMIMYIILVQVSIKRIQNFLISEDLDPDAVGRSPSTGPVISIRNGTFTWREQQLPALRDINLEVKEGQLVAVVGPVGCGKSSLINAILGEMEKVKGTVSSRGSVAYVPQQAWIQNATVRDNILFGQPYIRSKYRTVLSRCELERDLTILSAGDMTEIGEKGINLSGGQKQRVSMARAVYSEHEVYLLDDPLSAVDCHVGKAIFNKVIGPCGILRTKTRVLVTHGVHWLPMVDHIIVMNDGRISERGSYEGLMSHEGPFAQFLKTYLTEVFEVDEEEDPEIAEIHGRMRKRLGSVPSCASSDDDSLRLSSRSQERRRQQRSRRQQNSKTNHVPGSEVSLPATIHNLSRRHSSASGQHDLEDSTLLSPTSDVDTDMDSGYHGGFVGRETLGKGKVRPGVFLYFAKAVGLLPLMLAFLSFCLYQGLSVGANYWLKAWSRYSALASQYDINSTSRFQLPSNYNQAGSVSDSSQHSGQEFMTGNKGDGTSFYLGIYGVLGVGQAFNALYWTRMARGARVLHSRMADSLLHAPMSFFDTTPSGRVLNRVSCDVEAVDTTLPVIVRDWLVTFALVLVTLVVMVTQAPFSLVVLVPVVVLYHFCQRFYVPTARQLRRMECASRSPIYELFSETLNGSASIRAYGATHRFLEESKQRVDKNQVFFFASQAAMRWMQWNLDVLSAVLVAAASIFTITNTHTTAADAGLCISYALQVSGTLTWMTRQMCELQSKVVSVERLKEYSLLEREAEWILPNKRPPPRWPCRGEVTFFNYQARYREGLELVLKGVTCNIKHGEKVGIVGRTGAGKSSLTLSLFRLIEAAGGCILIDGINIADMGLHDLRSRLTILPQDPVLFSGTLRMNLDPFDQYSDSQLWTALDRAHLRQAVMALPGQLAFLCLEEGNNLSVGQRQLVCLARTLLRKTQILVLDEATAAVDMETDALIQNTIRSAFSSCTVITIAHRLNTIMDYDKILVMADGRAAEFAPPGELLSNRHSLFFSMARQASLA